MTRIGQTEVELERLRAQVEETARECGVQKTENERLRAVVDAARQFRQARIEMMTYGWNAHEHEAQAMRALMAALIALDDSSQT